MKYFHILSITIMFFILVTFDSVAGEKNDKKILEENLPLFMAASNCGKEFYLTFHPCWDDVNSPNNSIRIYVSSMYATTVKLEIPGLEITRTKEIKPNQVIEFELPVSEALLYTKGSGALPVPPHPEEIGVGRAIKITSDDPIICYGMVRFLYTSDGYMAIPVNNWGKDYQVASYADPTSNKDQFLPSYTSIIAAYDNTEVKFKLGGSVSAGALLQNNDTLLFGNTIKRTLNKGDVWLIPGIGPYNDLTGSQINATKNIGVISGNFCAYVPTDVSACDYIIEQDVPSEYWGKNYFVPTIINRKNSSILKIFAKEANTSISFNNIPMFNIAELNGKSGLGYIETRSTQEEIPAPVLINSDKEINVVLYNPGQGDDNVMSDPFQMNIVSDAQYQTDVTFNTPGIHGGLGFRENYLNIIYKSKTNTIPDDIYFAEIANDTTVWYKLSEYSSSMGEPFNGEIPDKNGFLHYSKTIQLHSDGVYKLKAREPFAAHGYGFGDYDSYGYPLAGGMIDQSSGDVQVPEIQMVNLGDGNYEGQITEIGNADGITSKNTDKLESVLKASGFSFIDIIKAYSYNYKFERADFMPGETKVVNYKLTKMKQNEDSKAVIYISDRCGNDTTLVLKDEVALRNMTPQISGENTDFGYLKKGQKKQLTFKLTNPGKVDSKIVEDINFENINTGFKIISELNYPLKLKVNEEINFTVEFTAGNDEGEFLNKLSIKSGDSTINRLNIKAIVSNPTINTTDIDFSSFTIGKTTKESSLDIKNSGFTTLEINSIDFPKNDAFSFSKYQPSVEFPITVPPNKSVQFFVEFNPKVEGEFKDSLVFYSDGKIIKNVSYLTGKAIINSVEEFENKYGIINIIAKEGKITLKASGNLTLNSYNIYDLNGEILQTESPATILNDYNIKLKNISNSVYFIELNTQFGKVVKKIVVE